MNQPSQNKMNKTVHYSFITIKKTNYIDENNMNSTTAISIIVVR